MRKRLNAWWLVSGVALAVAGCGGGSSSGNGPTDPGTVDPGTGVNPQPNLSERIEPFDSLGKNASIDRKAQSEAVVFGAAAAQSIQKVSLKAPAASLKDKTLAAALDTKPGQPAQISVNRDVAQTATVAATTALLQWKAASNGSKIAAIAFDSPTAQGVRLGVLVQRLPADAVLRFYGAAGGEAVQVSAADLNAQAQKLADSGESDLNARTYWSPEFGSTQTVLEVEVGPNTDTSQVQIAVPRLSHFALNAAQLESAVQEKAASGSCNIDVMCQADYVNQGRSVARMTFLRANGDGFYCTGTLLNDAKSSRTPYFLSANHCISTQGEASSLNTDWFYQSSACNSGTASANARRLTRGATLLYATANTDTSFMQLNEAAPAGALFAGSYYGSSVPGGTNVAGIHHPNGDLQKLSIGTVQGFGQCSGDVCGKGDSSSPFYEVGWQQGTTEGGSSGSALLRTIGSQRYVTAQLYAGYASCTTKSGFDYYGRFDVSYQASIKRWLNP